MRPETLHILGESHISIARTVSVIVAMFCSVMAGAVVIMMSLPFFLTGWFVGGPILWIGEEIVAGGVICFMLSFGLYRGYLSAWCGAVLLALPLAVLAWWMTRVGLQTLTFLSAMLLILDFTAQFLLWKSETLRRGDGFSSEVGGWHGI